MPQNPDKPVRHFTGPTGHYFRGCIRQMQKDPLGFYTSTQKQYGHYVKITAVKGIDCYLFTHPDAVEHILHKNHRNYRKPDLFYKSVGLLVGNGLFTNEGDSWLAQRRLVQPAFHSQHLEKLCPQIVAAAGSFIQQVENEAGPVDIASAMMKLGLRIASTTLFTTDISGEADAVGKAFRTTFKHIGNRMNSLQLIPNWLPTPANQRFRNAKKFLDHVVLQMIDSRRKHSAQPADDFLNLLINAKDEQTGEAMPDRLLMDEILTLLTAGHENIGAALAWTWYLLAQHPEIQESLHEQVASTLNGRTPAFEDLSRLELVRAAFEESMRLFPPGWGELRESIQSDQIEGYTLPGNSLVILCQWVTHRHSDFWEDPLQFRPDRFLNTDAKSHPRFAYFPFGGGPRICIGMQLAILEATLVIATVVQHFQIELIPNQSISPDATFTLRPQPGVWVRLRRRT